MGLGRTAIGLAGILLGAALAARAGADAGGRVVVPEQTWDFGTVEQGTKVEHVFRLANRGSDTLRIDHVKSSCGCTVGVASARDVPAGGEGRITVTLDTARMAGRTNKVVSVHTSDPEASVVSLGMTGTVLADLVATPNALYLGHIRRGDAASREVLVTPGRTDATYAVTAVEHSNPALHTTLGPRPDGGQRVVVTLDRDTPLGRFNDTLTLRTTSPRAPVITVPVFGSIDGDVLVLPPQVTFGVTRSGSTIERELYIRNRAGRPLAVTRVDVPSDVVTYELTAVEEGQEYRLKIRLRDGLKPGKIETALEIHTSDPAESRIVVPLYAIVRDGRRRG